MIYQNKGFTIVELIVAMGLTGIVMAGVYKTFTWQQNVYYSQDATASAQQDVRAGLDILVRDLRMAGFASQTGIAGITVATANSITFTMDTDEDNVITAATEQISYSLSPAAPNGTLVRHVGTGAVDPVADPVAENIDVLDFVYLDSTGTVITAPVSAANLSKISSIQVTLVANSGKADKNYKDKNAYYRQPAPNTLNTSGGEILSAQNDNLRRRVLTSTVRCRNLGVQ
jgi:type IV pilus assembly protein PilW